MKLRIKIETEDGREICNELVDHAQYSVNNDLVDALHFAGTFQPPAKYSRGHYIAISGYVKNIKMKEELDEAIRINAKAAGHRV